MKFDAILIKLRQCEHACKCSEDEFGEHYMCTDLKVVLIVNLYPFKIMETSYGDIVSKELQLTYSVMCPGFEEWWLYK